MENFEGRSAVVTGAATGIGRSIALALAENGVNVAVADIDEDAADVTAADVEALGVRGISCKTDVSQLSDVTRLADEAYSAFGKVDILVNNAGVTMRPFRASWDTAYEDFQWMMNVNWWGVLHGFHIFVPRMRSHQGDKHIVSTSSMSSLKPIAGHAAYSASKMAVDGFSMAARREFREAKQNIGVSILFPGRVVTRIHTSERLRPVPERSDERKVTPWISYLDVPESPDPRRNGRTADKELGDPIQPDRVGAMVLEGIRRDVPFILTEPPPVKAIKERAEELMNAYLLDF